MKILAITEFKAHALQILGQVAETRESVMVTKRGKPLAEVVPFSPSKPAPANCPKHWFLRRTLSLPLGPICGMHANEIYPGHTRVGLVEHAPRETLQQG